MNQEEIKTNEEQAVVETVKEEYNGPKVKTYTTYDFKTLKYYNVFNMKYLRKLRLLYLVLAVLCLAYDAYYVFRTILPAYKEGEFAAQLLLIPCIFVLFAVYTVYLFFAYEKQIDKSLKNNFDYQDRPLTTLEITITTEKISLKSSSTNEVTEYDWAFVTRIGEIPQYYYLYIGKTPIIISKDSNNITEGDYETLVKIIKEQTELKPYKLVDKEIVKIPVTYVHKTIVEKAQEVEAEITDEVKDEEVLENTDTIDEITEENSNEEK